MRRKCYVVLGLLLSACQVQLAVEIEDQGIVRCERESGDGQAYRFDTGAESTRVMTGYGYPNGYRFIDLDTGEEVDLYEDDSFDPYVCGPEVPEAS